MWQSVLRILFLGVLVYGVYKTVPTIKPEIEEGLKKSGINQGLVLGEAGDRLSRVFTGQSDVDSGETVEDTVKASQVMGESVTKKIQEDIDKVKEGAKEAAGEQFCKSVLKTLEEECGKYYCNE